MNPQTIADPIIPRVIFGIISKAGIILEANSTLLNPTNNETIKKQNCKERLLILTEGTFSIPILPC